MNDACRVLVTRRRLLQGGALVVSGLACAPRAWSEAMRRSGPQDPIAIVGQGWKLGNSLIERHLEFNSEYGLFTSGIHASGLNADYILPDNQTDQGPWREAQEFSFLCNGVACAGKGKAFTLTSGTEAAVGDGHSLTVKLRHIELPLEVDVVYRVYDGHMAMRKHLVLRNTSSNSKKNSLHLSHMNIESLNISLGPANETTLLTQYGTTPRETFYTGRSEDAGLLVANGLTGQGFAVISEVPGYMKRTEIGGWDSAEGVRIGVMYDTDLMPFERMLAPGEEFTTASSSLVLFRNGDGFNDPHWALPSYTAKVLERRVDADGPPWIYNTWEPFERGINHDIAMELIDAAGAMGMDIFTIDDGWQQEYGENGVNLTAFPGGLQPIMDAVRAKGMRLGLWIPFAAIGMKTADYRPEWATLDQEGKPKTTGTMAGQKAVMCMSTPYRDRAAARITDAIERFNLAYVKLDLTTIFNAYGEAPGCWAKGHDHGSWAESLGRIYEGISYVTKKVYERHPEVLLDLTFELWGQKHIIDAGLLAAGDLDWMSNVDDREPDSAGPLQARQLLYLRAASMPVESMLIGNIHAELPTIQESFATAIGSAPLLLGDLRKLSPADRVWYREKIAWFKKLRRSTKISESFFPLGSWRQTTPAAWDGFARMARNGNGVIALFRNKSQVDEVTVQLPLLAAGSYRARSVMNGKELGVFTNSDWARGVAVRFTGTGRVEILEVSAVRG
jgi:alpha-galactosidase